MTSTAAYQGSLLDTFDLGLPRYIKSIIGSPYNALYIETITESLTVQYSQMYIFCMSEKFVFPFYSLNYMKLWNIYTLFLLSNSNGHKPINIPKICLLRD